MSVSGMGNAIQAVLIILTFGLFVTGAGILGIGIWTIVTKQLVATYVYFNIDAVLIAAGGLILLLGLILLIAVKKEVRCILFLGAILMLVLAVGIVLAGVALFIFRPTVTEHMRTELAKSVAMYDISEPVADGWRAVQNFFECCGVRKDPTKTEEKPWRIWKANSQLFKTGTDVVPESCCRRDGNKRPMDCQKGNEKNMFEDDCYSKFIDFLSENGMLIGGAVAGLGSGLTLFATLLFSLLCMIE